MVEEVVDGAEPEPFEEFRAPGTDALYELDRLQEQIVQGAWPPGPGSGLRWMPSSFSVSRIRSSGMSW